jgi:antitoxin PrlF
MPVLKATVTSKGQITLPKQLRDLLAIHEGDKIEFMVEDASHASLRKYDETGSSAGLLKHLAKGRPVSLEEMDAAIRNHARKKAGG